MQCTNCQKERHHATRCNSRAKCRTCARCHQTGECLLEAVKCANCEGPYRAGSSECGVRKKEKQIMKIQRTMKVGKRVAREVLNRRNLEATDPRVEFEKILQIVSHKELRIRGAFKVESYFENSFGAKKKRTLLLTGEDSL